MLRITISAFFGLVVAASAVSAQNMVLSISSDDYQVTTVFNDVGTFDIEIEIDAPLATGTFVNPDVVGVDYSVSGVLVDATPSGFPSFALEREMTGAEFYAQGSSLSFEISPTAVLTDGVQVAELAGDGVVFTFNGREVGNGRFHPALFELNADGTGRIQNSNNVIVENPLQEVDFGDEYVTDLMFDPGNTTLIAATPVAPVPNRGGGGGALSPFGTGLLVLLCLIAAPGLRRRHI